MATLGLAETEHVLGVDRQHKWSIPRLYAPEIWAGTFLPPLSDMSDIGALDEAACSRYPRSRDRVESTLQTRGARVVPRVAMDLDFLLVGSIASPAWKHGNYGTKIEAAVKIKARGTSGRPWIIAEDHWVRLA